MVIQRIQTLYLLIAAVLMTLVNFVVSIATIAIGDSVITATIADYPPLMVLNLIAAALLLLDVFLFKTLPLQMKVGRISIVLIITSMLIETYVLCTLQEGQAIWTGSAIMLGISLIAAILALKGMQKDHKLLTSYDRLR